VYSREEREAARDLLESELSDREVARQTGVSRGTIANWRRGLPAMEDRYGRRPTRLELQRPLDDEAFSYLLGLYLGDGSIALTRKGYPFIRWTLDRKYPGIADECRDAITAATGVRSSLYDRPDGGLLIVQASGRFWLEFFPQHGPGKKHERPIYLAPWQQEITARHVRPFLRGLIHSDGSRCMNRFAVQLPSGRVGRYAYPRYFFTNYSEDILGIFCDHCELLGIRWTRSNRRNISVSHRDSVAILDSFVGPKS
jgi:hypothetical protein